MTKRKRFCDIPCCCQNSWSTWSDHYLSLIMVMVALHSFLSIVSDSYCSGLFYCLLPTVTKQRAVVVHLLFPSLPHPNYTINLIHYSWTSCPVDLMLHHFRPQILELPVSVILTGCCVLYVLHVYGTLSIDVCKTALLCFALLCFDEGISRNPKF